MGDIETQTRWSIVPCDSRQKGTFNATSVTPLPAKEVMTTAGNSQPNVMLSSKLDSRLNSLDVRCLEDIIRMAGGFRIFTRLNSR